MKDVCKSLYLTNHSLRCDSPDCTKWHVTECAHPLILEKRCIRCTRVMANGHGLRFDYLCPSLRLSKDHADMVREMRTEAMLRQKKLHLVLDLDQTLVHSVYTDMLTPEEKHLMAEADRNTRSFLDVSTAQGEGRGGSDLFLVCQSITKLRPFTREFLREASKMFELSIYTLGARLYASKIAKFLDPDGCYFSNRVISRDDCTVFLCKSLDVVLARESNVVIVDDNKTVWPDHARNLLVIEPYFYFSGGSEERLMREALRRRSEKRCMIGRRTANRSRPKVNEKSDWGDQALSIMLGRLTKIHRNYFRKKLGGGWVTV